MPRRSGQFVIPGEKLGVIEEFLPGPGTFTDNGEIYSLTTGYTLLDMLNKTVSVYPRVHLPIIPRVGNLVYGQITSVQDKVVIIRIWKIGKRILSNFFTGILHVSNVSSEYVRTMFDVFKAGDIIRAKVISTKNRTFHFSTADKHFGVIYAFCSQCGCLLVEGKKTLMCPLCKKGEIRKIADDYGTAII